MSNALCVCMRFVVDFKPLVLHVKTLTWTVNNAKVKVYFLIRARVKHPNIQTMFTDETFPLKCVYSKCHNSFTYWNGYWYLIFSASWSFLPKHIFFCTFCLRFEIHMHFCRCFYSSFPLVIIKTSQSVADSRNLLMKMINLIIKRLLNTYWPEWDPICLVP